MTLSLKATQQWLGDGYLNCGRHMHNHGYRITDYDFLFSSVCLKLEFGSINWIFFYLLMCIRVCGLWAHIVYLYSILTYTTHSASYIKALMYILLLEKYNTNIHPLIHCAHCACASHNSNIHPPKTTTSHYRRASCSDYIFASTTVIVLPRSTHLWNSRSHQRLHAPVKVSAKSFHALHVPPMLFWSCHRHYHWNHLFSIYIIEQQSASSDITRLHTQPKVSIRLRHMLTCH